MLETKKLTKNNFYKKNTLELNIKEKITIFGNIENGASVLTYKCLLKNKRKIKIIISPTVKIQGFSLKITNGQDKSLINEIGEALAEESMKEEMDNIGIVFLQLNEGNRVCMRGLNTKAESPCLLIAKIIDGKRT